MSVADILKATVHDDAATHHIDLQRMALEYEERKRRKCEMLMT